MGGWITHQQQSNPIQSNPSRPADGGGTPRRGTGGLACWRRRPRRRWGLRIPDASLQSVRSSPSNPNPPLPSRPVPSPSPSLCGASAIGYGVSSPSQPSGTNRRRRSARSRSTQAGGRGSRDGTGRGEAEFVVVSVVSRWSRRGAATAFGLGLGGSCAVRGWCRGGELVRSKAAARCRFVFSSHRSAYKCDTGNATRLILANHRTLPCGCPVLDVGLV